MMQISTNIMPFIKKENISVLPYCGIQGVKALLLKTGALLVQDDKQNVLGILTPNDILHKSHNLVIDCIREKVKISPEFGLNETLKLMTEEQSEVLPVYRNGVLQGLVFKDDLVKFITNQKNELELAISKKSVEISKANKDLSASKQTLAEICWQQSHETRQPVATLLGLLSLIDKSDLSQQNMELFEMLERTGEKLDQVIRDSVVKANTMYNSIDISEQALETGLPSHDAYADNLRESVSSDLSLTRTSQHFD